MQPPIHGHPDIVRYGVGLKLDQSLVGSSHKFCASTVLVNLEGEIVYRSKVLGFVPGPPL